MLYFIVTSVISAITSLFLGIYVYLKNRKSALNILGFWGCLGLFFYFSFYFLWAWQTEYERALFWGRMLNLTVLFIPLYYFHWGLVFLKKQKENKTILILVYLITFIFLPFTFSKYFIKDVGPISFFHFFPQAGWLYLVYIIHFSVVMAYLVYLMYRKIPFASGFYREQIRYVLLALLAALMGGSSNYPLLFKIDIYAPLGNPLLVLMPIFLVYSTLRHRLFNLKLVMRQCFVYFISISAVILAGFSVNTITGLFFSVGRYGEFIITAVISLILFLPVKNYIYKFANKHIFSYLYDSREVISILSEKLKSILIIDKVYETIVNTMVKYFRASLVGILTYNNEEGDYIIKYNGGFNFEPEKKLKGDRAIQELFFAENKIIITEDLKDNSYVKYKRFLDEAISLNIEVLIPLNIKDKNMGILILGPKTTGDIYNKEDLEIFMVIAAQAAIAMENALLYEESKGFNIKLKKEIEKATRDLLIANAQLKKLDAAKSDFISIASHQLRTPLTAIKGYISMMLEGDFGKLTTNEHSSLEKVFDSNERLIHLVEDLLNVSRIESGRIQFNLSDTQLEKTVASVIDELSNNAKKKGLKLEYQKPDKPLPLLKIDEEKIRQVIMNLIDNAIKYTKKGRVKVKLEKTNHHILFSVTDTGMGVKKEDQANLFKKFSRGTGTSLIHTEGTGLGLYVAKEMIGAHKGKIWVESEGEGRGSKFIFKLPVNNKQMHTD